MPVRVGSSEGLGVIAAAPPIEVVGSHVARTTTLRAVFLLAVASRAETRERSRRWLWLKWRLSVKDATSSLAAAHWALQRTEEMQRDGGIRLGASQAPGNDWKSAVGKRTTTLCFEPLRPNLMLVRAGPELEYVAGSKHSCLVIWHWLGMESGTPRRSWLVPPNV